MNGLMNKYRESLKNTQNPVLMSSLPKIKLDLSGLIKYAKSKNMQPSELTVEEKEKFYITISS